MWCSYNAWSWMQIWSCSCSSGVKKQHCWILFGLCMWKYISVCGNIHLILKSHSSVQNLSVKILLLFIASFWIILTYISLVKIHDCTWVDGDKYIFVFNQTGCKQPDSWYLFKYLSHFDSRNPSVKLWVHFPVKCKNGKLFIKMYIQGV